MYQEPKKNTTNPELQKYYAYLKQNGADVPPNYTSFENTLKDVNASKQYYDYLKKEGFDAPDSYDVFASTFGLKKKESSQSPSVQTKSGSGPKTGSSGTAKQLFRLPTEKEFEEGQKRGEFAPNRSMPKSKETQYDLEGNTGKVVQKPKEVIGKESDYVLETKEINQKPFEKQTAVNPRFSEEQKAEVKSEISQAEKLNTPEYEEEI